jgi:hypothetical protein
VGQGDISENAEGCERRLAEEVKPSHFGPGTRGKARPCSGGWRKVWTLAGVTLLVGPVKKGKEAAQKTTLKEAGYG